MDIFLTVPGCLSTKTMEEPKAGCTESGNGANNPFKKDLTSQDLKIVPSCLSDPRLSSHIQELFLDYNNIGYISEDVFLCLKQLKIFSVVGNDLCELPLSLGNLTQLGYLYLQENCLQTLPITVGHLKSLQILNVVGNHLKELPHTFGQLSLLEKLCVDENNLTCLPNAFGHLKNLKLLEMTENKLKSLPHNFGQLEKLEVLNLCGNKLEHYLPESFSYLKNLTDIDLSQNNLKRLPDVCKSQAKIKKLYVESNILEALPNWINNLPKVEEFSVKDNQLKAEPFSELIGQNNVKLKHFDISGNFITGIPESIGQLELLEKVHIGSVIHELERRNFQNGNWMCRLPDSFSHLVRLREAHLDENQLEHLPENFGNLISLEFLDLGR